MGWGRTTKVKAGDACTQKQADAWLIEEYDAFETAVLKLLGKAKTTANQLGALVSFAYNLGIGALAKSTLLTKHLVGDYAGAAREFAKWKFGGGRVLPGLIKRRAAEAALYLS
ncbi:lysozyme [Sphingobium yanoikuyae]|uniref:Lysozyme n=1 Tax=Sphingobium yanoikuyae TaxID=13690 RepID=A0AA43BD61_SPHYA|nr:lysozyme [Sphingobium yanoikuyae]MDH2135118.1 lysozyme [Sphingobium yanoikuyae]MDH2153123.1 lysozyme [Sphingobium yanoikuyae]MDH2170477.1 lysozyme [Sphingobium yanoikuyae]